MKNEVLSHHVAPANLEFLPGAKKIRQTPLSQEHDLGIVVDLDSLERLGSTRQFFEKLPRLIVIDHHVPHMAPGDLRIIDVEAPATSLILTRLFQDIEAEITPEIATCLLTGIVTDTGSFRFRNTTPESLHLSAWLIEHGGDINQISEEIFQRRPLAATRLLGTVLDRMKLACDNKLAWAVLDYHDFEQAGATDEDTEGFVNELLSIDTVLIAVLMREAQPGRVRISLRSRADIDVASVAREIGGGGHKNAAGCVLPMHLEEAEQMLVPRLKKCLGYS